MTQSFVTFDLEYIQKNAASDACMIVLTSLQEGEEVKLEVNGPVERLKPVASILS